MQQTETYKLNLIESSDPFLPNALNENTQKIEEVVSEKLGEMDARVTVLEGKKFACGTYNVSVPEDVTVEIGFTPEIVFIRQAGSSPSITAMVTETTGYKMLRITEGGFIVNVVPNEHWYPGNYNFIAFG